MWLRRTVRWAANAVLALEPMPRAVKAACREIERDFAGAMVVCVSTGIFDDIGGDYMVNAYFIPDARLSEFDDYTEGLAERVFDKSGVDVIVISCGVKATEEYYPEKIEERKRRHLEPSRQ